MRLCDEVAGIAAIRHCGVRVVTAGVDRMTFLHPVHVGQLVTFRATVNAAWRTSVEVPGTRKQPGYTFEHDEQIRDDTTAEKLAALPAQPGTTQMTAGNSSALNDGASAVVLASGQAVTDLGAEPMARVVSSATYALDPQVMGIAPAWAIPQAIRRAGLSPEEIDVWEIHEAFSAQALGVLRELPNQLDGFEVPDEKLNPNGGAVAIGHPFGSSGTRYVLTLATELHQRGARYGVLGVCVGSGQGVAMVLENVSGE